MGLTNLINTEDAMLTEDDLKRYCHHLSLSANELDMIIKELNNFIERSEQENREPCLIKPITRVSTRQFSLPATLKIVK